jgi:molybdenum cofactor biosynthesis protein B
MAAERAFVPVRIAVLTVSDTRGPREDRSGDVLVERLTGAGHVLAARSIVRDEQAAIAAQLRAWIADPGVDAVISTGGTGLTGRDVTVEAHESVYEKAIPAFGTLFTMISAEKIGTSAIQSRACAGVAGGTYLFALPGSPGACRDGWDGILAHQLDYRHMPCNFVEIMQRLEEAKVTPGRSDPGLAHPVPVPECQQQEEQEERTEDHLRDGHGERNGGGRHGL